MYCLSVHYLLYAVRVIQGKDLETIDLKRTGRSATAGLLIHGPLCHFWIQLMQNYLVRHPTLMHLMSAALLLYNTRVQCCRSSRRFMHNERERPHAQPSGVALRIRSRLTEGTRFVLGRSIRVQSRRGSAPFCC